MNRAKEIRVRAMVKAYRRLCREIGRGKWQEMLGENPLNLPAVKMVTTPQPLRPTLSRELRECCRAQVESEFRIFWEHFAWQFSQLVQQSQLEPTRRAELARINQQQRWFGRGEVGGDVSPASCQLARQIAKAILARLKKPNLAHLDPLIPYAQLHVQKSHAKGRGHQPFVCWIRLDLEDGQKPLVFPISTPPRAIAFGPWTEHLRLEFRLVRQGRIILNWRSYPNSGDGTWAGIVKLMRRGVQRVLRKIRQSTQ